MYSDDNADGEANIYSHIQFSWSFKHDDLKKAVLSLLVNDELQSDANVITMVKLIKDQFQDENEMFAWTKDIFEKVKIQLLDKRLKLWALFNFIYIKYGTSFAKNVQFNYIYISVKTTEGYDLGHVHRSGLSGRYKYHSTDDNADIFRAARLGDVYLHGEHFFLIYRNGFWFITNERFGPNNNADKNNKLGSFLRVQTTGK